MNKLTLKDLEKLRIWVDEIYYDYLLVSTKSQKNLDKIARKLGLETHAEHVARVEKNTSAFLKIFKIIQN
jgi:hypothetical protein